MHNVPSDVLEMLPLSDAQRRQFASTSNDIANRLPSVTRKRLHTANLRRCYRDLQFSINECLDNAANAYEITQTQSLGQCTSMATNQMRRYIKLSDGLKAPNQCKFLLAVNRSDAQTRIVLDRNMNDDAHDNLFVECANAIRIVRECRWTVLMESDFTKNMRMCGRMTSVHQHALAHRSGRGRPCIMACDEHTAQHRWRARLLQLENTAEIILVSTDDEQPASPFDEALVTFLPNILSVVDDACVSCWSNVGVHLDGQYARFNTDDENDDDGESVIIVSKSGEMATALACVFHVITGMRMHFAHPITDAGILQQCETMWANGIELRFNDDA